jgi:hypothetical protein
MDEEPSQNQPINYFNGSAATKEAMDKLVPGLNPSEYGKMPATYYANSQKVAPTTIATDVVGGTTQNTKSKSPKKSTSGTSTSSKPIREPILARDRYDGVDSDDESGEENLEDDESEEDMPQVVGDVEVDMVEEEEEFLEFSRQALGISDAQWNDILQDRKGRGGKCTLKPIKKQG